MCLPSNSCSSGLRRWWAYRAIRYKDRIVGVVMYRDNTIIDVVHEIDEDA